MWYRRSRPAPGPAVVTPAREQPDPGDRQPTDRCGCQKQIRLRDPAIGSFLNHHLRPVARLAAHETEWVCPSSLLHWRLIDRPDASRELLRLDSIRPTGG
jgi:hypothetical protein